MPRSLLEIVVVVRSGFPFDDRGPSSLLGFYIQHNTYLVVEPVTYAITDLHWNRDSRFTAFE